MIPAERSRAAGGTIIALFFNSLHENFKPYKRAENNVVASTANGMTAAVLLLLSILQGGLMPKPVVATLCIVFTLVIFPAVAAFQLRSLARREAALAAMSAARGRWFRAKAAVSLTAKLSKAHAFGPPAPAATPNFAATFSTA